MGIFNNLDRKTLAQLCKKSEDIGNEISKEINEFIDDLNADYEENKIVVTEFSSFICELESKLSPEEISKLQSFSTRLIKVKRCAKKGVEAMRELGRDQRRATRETLREYEAYL